MPSDSCEFERIDRAINALSNATSVELKLKSQVNALRSILDEPGPSPELIEIFERKSRDLQIAIDERKKIELLVVAEAGIAGWA